MKVLIFVSRICSMTASSRRQALRPLSRADIIVCKAFDNSVQADLQPVCFPVTADLQEQLYVGSCLMQKTL